MNLCHLSFFFNQVRQQSGLRISALTLWSVFEKGFSQAASAILWEMN